ncbi:MAG: transposase [Hymenobacter sp.]
MAETTYRPFGKKAPVVRLIVRRVKPTPGSQLALLVDWSFHAFVTDRDGETIALEADHRRHAVVENTIRDLKYGVGLNHMPSGRFGANAAWLALGVMAHNLARWTSRLGLGETLIATDTLRRRYLGMPGRLTHSARKPTLHLPAALAVGRALRDRPGQPAQRRRPGHLRPRTQRRPPRPSRRVPPPPDQPERLGPQRPLSGPQTLSTPRWLSSST